MNYILLGGYSYNLVKCKLYKVMENIQVVEITVEAKSTHKFRLAVDEATKNDVLILRSESGYKMNPE